MIEIRINSSIFRHDCLVMTKAFFPAEEVSFIVEEAGGEKAEAEDWVYTVSITKDDNPAPLADIALPASGAPNTAALRNELKRRLYSALAACCGYDLPWGTLTGVRPTKLIRDLMKQGIEEKDIKALLKQFYFVGREKTGLALQIAKHEESLLSKRDWKKGYSLYIGIPFCPTTCLYCSFPSFPITAYRERADSYINALIQEMDCIKEIFRNRPLNTVYIGGGTPTSLDPAPLKRLLTELSRRFDIENTLEFTVEAGRADSVTLEKLEVLKCFGVNRISINPQTMNEKTLQYIGRKAGAADVIEAFHMARELGFNNINMDIILGLPGEGITEVRKTVEAIGELKPDNLTVHSLAIKRASKLREVMDRVGYDSLINTGETMEIAKNAALSMGMEPYYLYRQKNMAGNFENTGYSLPGKEGLYNVLIMEEIQDIAAIGAGTVSKRIFEDGNIKRIGAHKDPALYIRDIDEMISRKRELYGI